MKTMVNHVQKIPTYCNIARRFICSSGEVVHVLVKAVELMILLMSEAIPGLEKKKILISGLDNAGKTSLLDLVQGKLVKEIEMQPTRGISRREAEIMGQALTIADLGGQEQYRKQYEDNPIKVFPATDAFIFVVDLQDRQRHFVSLGYFETTLGLFDGLGVHPRVFVLFHKFDHTYRASYNDPRKNVREEVNSLKDRFTASARKYNFDIYEFYRTSIYDEWSVYAAFYDVWSSLITRLDSVQEYLDQLVSTVPGVSLVLLLDTNGNLIGKNLAGSTMESAVELVELANKAITALVELRNTKTGEMLGDTNLVTFEIGELEAFVRSFQSDEKTFFLILAKSAGSDDETRDILNNLTYSLSVFLPTLEDKTDAPDAPVE